MSRVELSPTVETLAQERLIVALDFSTANEARNLISALDGIVSFFKVGSQLFTAAGPNFVRELTQEGRQIFLDLKYHDIPNTVAAAGAEATRLGVSIFNVHASGGNEMMARTVEAVNDVSTREGIKRPKVIAVTVLTSLNDAALNQTGIQESATDQVRRLASLAASTGMDGVVASPKEVQIVKQVVRKHDFIVVTPGVRPEGSGTEDQKRVSTPRAAIAAGSDYLVVGRPITGARDPATAANAIIADIASALGVSK